MIDLDDSPTILAARHIYILHTSLIDDINHVIPKSVFSILKNSYGWVRVRGTTDMSVTTNYLKHRITMALFVPLEYNKTQ